MSEPEPIRIHADFNGLFSELLCLSHRETCVGADGQDIVVREGSLAFVGAISFRVSTGPAMSKVRFG
jgi:hypothetical protein